MKQLSSFLGSTPFSDHHLSFFLYRFDPRESRGRKFGGPIKELDPSACRRRQSWWLLGEVVAICCSYLRELDVIFFIYLIIYLICTIKKYRELGIHFHS